MNIKTLLQINVHWKVLRKYCLYYFESATLVLLWSTKNHFRGTVSYSNIPIL